MWVWIQWFCILNTYLFSVSHIFSPKGKPTLNNVCLLDMTHISSVLVNLTGFRKGKACVVLANFHLINTLTVKGWIVPPPKVCCSPYLQYFRKWTFLEKSICRGNQVKMRSVGWTLIQKQTSQEWDYWV